MLFLMFSVFDSKAVCYSQPWLTVSKGSAIRAFGELAVDPNHQFGKYPADFTLFEIGTFDDSTGHVALHESKIPLGTALEHAAEQMKLRQVRSQPLPLTPVAEAVASRVGERRES